MATALAVAYEVGKLGANSIEATVDRSDLVGIEAAPLYLHLAKVFCHGRWPTAYTQQRQYPTTSHEPPRLSPGLPQPSPFDPRVACAFFTIPNWHSTSHSTVADHIGRREGNSLFAG